MGMKFEDAGGGGKRKWQCFVCGKNYDGYEEYKSHILDDHDEGREYIRCPDCDAPVRDVKMHYKAKHPKRVMPKGIQNRVAVWHDFKPGKDGKTKKITRKPTFRNGVFCSRKSSADFVYRSGLECEFYECLENDLDVQHFVGEPFKIPYYYRNEWHNYIPDLKVVYADNSVEIWEIKPANQTDYEINKAKWAAANNFCSNLGWNFVVLTEIGLGKLKTKLKRQNQINETTEPSAN